MARSDEIDELVSSVRNLVANKDAGAVRKMPPLGRLVLTPALRVDATPEILETSENSAETAPVGVLVLDNAIPVETVSLAVTIAELEAAVTSQPDDREPDRGETFEQSAWAVSAFQPPQDDSLAATTALAEDAETPVDDAHVDDAAAAIIDMPQPDTEDADKAGPASDLETRITNDLVMHEIGGQIDHAALREVVLRTLREELAGEMGERITRNVRKLVRREINRVLASRDLD